MAELTPQQDKAMAGIIAGQTEDYVAKSVGVSPITIVRWRKSKAWVEEWARRSEMLRDAIDSKIRASGELGLQVIIQIASGRDEKKHGERLVSHRDRLKAAEALVRLAKLEPAQKIEVSGALDGVSDDALLARIEKIGASNGKVK